MGERGRKTSKTAKKVPKLYKQQAVISVPAIIYSAAAGSCDLISAKNTPEPRLIGILITQMTTFLDKQVSLSFSSF